MGIENISLEGLEIAELQELRDMVTDRIDEIKKENKKRLMEIMEAEAAKLGIPISEILSSGSKSKEPRKTVKAKYRNEHGKEWSGRGPNAPAWVLEHLGVEKIDRQDPEQAKKLEELLVDKD
ncbi:trans-acting regulatory protein HvrA [Roseovarius mucosus]|uniref:Trans-acting regulatory protein HvrA n=1 Tax=Roseovarius mucosus TaxID=215743 RepID=A0A1V0RRY7_9RHOB|nr:H-NS histone family protein [Roseovarius mucosus]ARE84405.1 trans-acting regulatory protein HvrA [Roseovarius mucosus]